MPAHLPKLRRAADLIGWLALQRNDLEPAAMALEPSVGTVLAALRAQADCRLARMSGSGATCFGLCDTARAAARMAKALAAAQPGWWVRAVRLS
jgi:4-diphosphocytidyl-2-C-methyl-D-erythritol kinase